MPLPNSIREEFVLALKPYSGKDIPDSVRMTAWQAAENMLDIAKKLNLIDHLPEVEKISYEDDTLFVTVDGETIKIPR